MTCLLHGDFGKLSWRDEGRADALGGRILLPRDQGSLVPRCGNLAAGSEKVLKDRGAI
jgi:hypothetical protein